MTVELAFLTIAEASALIKTRQLSPVEYVEALIRRTETFDPQLHAYITPTFDLARQRPSRPNTILPPAPTAGRCTASHSR